MVHPAFETAEQWFSGDLEVPSHSFLQAAMSHHCHLSRLDATIRDGEVERPAPSQLCSNDEHSQGKRSASTPMTGRETRGEKDDTPRHKRRRMDVSSEEGFANGGCAISDSRSAFHTYKSSSNPSTITRIASEAANYSTDYLLEALRVAEQICDVKSAKKIGRALDERARKEERREDNIREQMIHVGESREKAVPEKCTFDFTLPGGKMKFVTPRILRLDNNDLQLIAPSPDPDKGTALYYQDSSNTPVFIVAPRNVSRERLKIHSQKKHKQIRKAARNLFEQDRFVPRGSGRLVFFDGCKCSNGDVKDGYVCLGPKVRRGGPGVSEYCTLSRRAPREHDVFQNLAARMEHITRQYIPSNDLRVIEHAHNVAQWPRFKAIRDKSKECKMYAGFNLSSGSYHNAHLDDDFGYTTVVTSLYSTPENTIAPRAWRLIAKYFRSEVMSKRHTWEGMILKSR
ncbi:hypothetical protein THAOC_36781 [Thalassiosira oceanica]|uniref:Uncharacterized protein n=1 Tax=Thalassiosira oceanica TaxID=159749 RepID=K0R1B9_THAOC|nr:hypothetical protein THAOC_36781 [Thalassiosira oceanica]|eukprot:EJK44664.1 hypothetical protein THAOC_36781 [Thalassiosira oceanica]